MLFSSKLNSKEAVHSCKKTAKGAIKMDKELKIKNKDVTIIFNGDT